MADYYPLIAKAVTGLDKNTGEIRRALYDRARAALVGQLRSVDPPLNESDITRERLALEEAIRKVETEASKRKPEPEPEDSRPSLSDEGLRGFRAVVAEAEGLGDATAEANREAHERLDQIPTEGVGFERGDHALPVERLAPDHLAEAPPVGPPLPFEADIFEAPPAEQPPSEAEETVTPPPVAEMHGDSTWRPATQSPVVEDEAVDDDDYVRPRRSFAGAIKWIVLLLIIAAAAGAAYWQRDTLTKMVARLRTPQASSQSQQPAQQPAAKPKITDRVGGGSTSAPANAPTAAVAQKVVLYDEDPSNPQGKRYVGSAVWRTETVSPGPGLAPEIAIRADVEIPERHMRMTFSLRRNTDKALPASHTIEIMFTLPQDFSEGGVNNIPGVLMKQEEQARGVPLAGLAVKVTSGYFLIGLSAVDSDRQRNLDLLKNRDWFDIPLVYNTNKRAILALEKGEAGKRVFDEAFRAWGQ